MNAPCLKCEDRHTNCHSDCAAYIEFANIKASERNHRLKEAEINAYVNNQIYLNHKETQRTPKRSCKV